MTNLAISSAIAMADARASDTMTRRLAKVRRLTFMNVIVAGVIDYRDEERADAGSIVSIQCVRKNFFFVGRKVSAVPMTGRRAVIICN